MKEEYKRMMVHSEQVKLQFSTGDTPAIYFKVRGQLGNHMFTIASASGIAHKNNMKALFLKHNSLNMRSIFPEINISFGHLEGGGHFPKDSEGQGYIFDNTYFNLPKQKVVIFDYLQSFKYFKDIEYQIYKMYSTMNSALLNLADLFVRRVQIKENFRRLPTVCVHVWRGNMTLFKYEETRYNIPERDDVVNAMQWMEKKIGGISISDL